MDCDSALPLRPSPWRPKRKQKRGNRKEDTIIRGKRCETYEKTKKFGKETRNVKTIREQEKEKGKNRP